MKKWLKRKYDYQFKNVQVKEQIQSIQGISSTEATQLAKMVKENLEEGSRTIIAVSDNALISFQLDVGLAFKGKIDSGFQKADSIYLVTTDKDNTFKAKIALIPYKTAKRKANELDLPPKRTLVQSLIWFHNGTVAVNKFNIHQYKQDFLNKGNQVMADFINKAILNNEFNDY